MAIKKFFNRDYFECVCGIPEHTLRFTSVAEPIFDDDGEFYVETFLNQYLPWYKRLYVAIKYVFGRPPVSAYDCTILTQDEANKLATLLSPELQSLQATKIALMKALCAESLKVFPKDSDENPGVGDSEGDIHES